MNKLTSLLPLYSLLYFSFPLYAMAINFPINGTVEYITLNTSRNEDTPCVKDLAKYISLLQEFNIKNKKMGIVSFSKKKTRLAYDDQCYKHDLVNRCFRKMVLEESLDPLFVTWHLFISQSERCSNTDLFLKEYTILIFSVYKNILVACAQEKSAENDTQQNIQLGEVVDLYNEVSKLPIKELMKVLDKCFRQLATIMVKYGMLNEQLSWNEWIRLYWWTIPTTLFSFVSNMVK